MGLFEQFPYTNFHDLNLDWFLKTFKDLLDEWERQRVKFHDMEDAFAAMQQWVTHYFDNLDIQQEINDKLDEMAHDGTLASVLSYVLEGFELEIGTRIDALESRMDTFSNLAEGSTTGDAELMDARIAYQGFTFPNAGDAVRGQAGDALQALQAVSPWPDVQWVPFYNIDAAGNLSSNQYMAVTHWFRVSPGDAIISLMPERDNNNLYLVAYVSEFDDNNDFIRRTQITPFNVVVMGSTTARARFAFGRPSSSGQYFTNPGDFQYFNALFAEKKASGLTAWGYVGRFADLSYTTVAECVDPGYYQFSGSDTVTDLPDGWTGGGLVRVYADRLGNKWQQLDSSTAHYMRYGTSGYWYTEDPKISVKYTADPAGPNDSVEQLHIVIPRKTAGTIGTSYLLGRCVDPAKNADVWRIIYAYRWQPGYERQLTSTGEWECALHLSGRSDFSGGYVHGDEMQQSMECFGDGTLIAAADLTGLYDDVKIVRKSYLYDPNDSTTVIAEHGVEYHFTKDGLTMKQAVKWLGSYQLTPCYLAMLPFIKSYADYMYTDADFDVQHLTQSNYSITIPGATAITEYNDTYDTFFEMSKTAYPSGLTGGDCALIGDNGGLGYNKMYFPVCTSGTVQNGTLWLATVHYKDR